MVVKGILDEDFVNYRAPSMFISTNTCTFKCDKESGVSCCQNSSLAKKPGGAIPDDLIISRYLSNKITRAIVFGGLEPLDQFGELMEFLTKLRVRYDCHDPVVIYTGYNKNEILDKILKLQKFDSIIIKYGRFIPNDEKRYDEVLGVELASSNQVAEMIS